MKRVFNITILFFVVEILIGQTSFSQTVVSTRQDDSKSFIFPILIKSGEKLTDFVPKGWNITDKLAGDLNKDNVEDAAIILEYQDSVMEVNRAIWRDTKQKTKPRILLLLLRVENHYELKVQQNDLILRENERDHTDSYDGMLIKKGILHLNFKWDMRGGGQEIHYIVRYQLNDFYLIGYTFESGYHSSISTSDFNFSTKEYIHHVIDDERGFGGKYHEYKIHKVLPSDALKKVRDLKEPDTWKIIDAETI